MNYKTINVKISYEEGYLPPRCKKPRLQTKEETVSLKIREVTEEEAPIAIIVRRPEAESWIAPLEMRMFNGQLYGLDGDNKMKLSWIRDVSTKTLVHDKSQNWVYTTDKEYCKKHLEKFADNLIICNNFVYRHCKEPFYAIVKFGIDNYNAKTKLAVIDNYKIGIGPSLYFNALELEKARETAREIVEQRGGEFEDIDTAHEINVLIPESIKRNPKKDLSKYKELYWRNFEGYFCDYPEFPCNFDNLDTAKL